MDAGAELVTGREPTKVLDAGNDDAVPAKPVLRVTVTSDTIPPGPTETDTVVGSPDPEGPIRGGSTEPPTGDEDEDEDDDPNTAGTKTALGWFGQAAQQLAVVDEPADPQHHCVVLAEEDEPPHGVIAALSPVTDEHTFLRQPPAQSGLMHESRLNWTGVAVRPVCASASCS